ncbi:inositol monophosphatase family protein [Streptomyces jumonjinensis]|uniref:inositol monophosphatase family protein n=1 Tax=Streptomyces jumonjinensis TaxID=1945 RepID=UPI0037B9D620
MIPDLPALLDTARAAVHDAHRLLHTLTPDQITAKGDRDLVTNADLAVERHTRAQLAGRTPHIGFLGEEEGGTTTGTHWVLGPVDGTANYAPGLPLCGISLALIHDHTPVLGVISLPLLKRTYWGAPGICAWRDGTPIRASAVRTLDQAMIAIGDYGTLDASLTLGNRSWDMAAGAALARAAGALVTDTDGTPHTSRSTATIAAAMLAPASPHSSPIWKPRASPSTSCTRAVAAPRCTSRSDSSRPIPHADDPLPPRRTSAQPAAQWEPLPPGSASG